MSSWELHSEQDQTIKSLPSGCFSSSRRKTQLIDVIIVSELYNEFKGATFYWGEIEQAWRKGRWDVALVWKVSPKQNTDERSMWALEGRAIQAEGTAPSWDRAAGSSGETGEKTGVRWAAEGVEKGETGCCV